MQASSSSKKSGSAKGAKQSGAGEPAKGAEKRRIPKDVLADQRDNKDGNIGPSGQGTHRGRERRTIQSAASGRPDIGSAGSRTKKK
jgi:hypothetical protein